MCAKWGKDRRAKNSKIKRSIKKWKKQLRERRKKNSETKSMALREKDNFESSIACTKYVNVAFIWVGWLRLAYLFGFVAFFWVSIFLVGDCVLDRSKIDGEKPIYIHKIKACTLT